MPLPRATQKNESEPDEKVDISLVKPERGCFCGHFHTEKQLIIPYFVDHHILMCQMSSRQERLVRKLPYDSPFLPPFSQALSYEYSALDWAKVLNTLKKDVSRYYWKREVALKLDTLVRLR